MRKRLNAPNVMETNGDHRRKKGRKSELSPDDKISQLPPEILIYILSLLTLKEAARTATLSTVWKNIWKQTPILVFDDDKSLDEILDDDDDMLYKREISKYVRWVNRVLKLHKSTKLDTLKFRFDVRKVHNRTIRAWIKYAYEREVHKLELDLRECGMFLRNYRRSCTFPDPLMLSSRKLFSNNCGFKSLRDLCLRCVNVSGEVVEYFLHNCPLLERLSVEGSGDLINLEVSGPSLKLKYLSICQCGNAQVIKLSDINLVSLDINTWGDNWEIHNVPKLVELFFGCSIEGLEFFDTMFSWFSCCVAQLEVLTLYISGQELGTMEQYNFPELPKLKKLVFEAVANEDKSVLAVTALVRACPLLEKFGIKFFWNNTVRRSNRRVEKAVDSPLRRLKEVEICGYYGRITDLELIEYFVKNSTALEKIVIDPHDQPPSRNCLTMEEQVARKFPRQPLIGIVPANVELIVKQ